MDKETASQWLKKTGPESDVVLSSRVRLARNISDYPFPNQTNSEELEEITEKVSNLIGKDNKFDLRIINLSDLAEIERKMLVERHLISPEHAVGKEGSLVALSEDEVISLMVNEEDHFRSQILLPGLQLERTWELADEVDDYLEGEFELAFDKKYGYLTACPTNVGTGLRASVMVHLPALQILKRVSNLMTAISKLGLAVRGLYGEGTETVGNIYQISNQVTLGRSEAETIDNLTEVTKQIVGQERSGRQVLLEEQEIELKDRVCRSYGILKNAYSISIKEALDLISNVRLGSELGIIDSPQASVLNQLMIAIRPATLKKIKGSDIPEEEEDIKRAEIIRNKLREE